MKKNRNCVPDRGGFTMIEMLLVVALIALLAGLAGGLYKGTLQGLLVKKSARDFYLAARYARMLAIERQTPCKIELSKEKNSFSIVSERFNEQTGQVEKLIVKNYYIKPVQFTGDIKFENIQIFSNESAGESESDDQVRSIVFLPNGTAQASLVQIGDGKTHYTASICSSTGKVKVYSGQAESVESQVIDLDKMR
jgi:prepilin-type N-terminal cleavage/methylation domain-containing protein